MKETKKSFSLKALAITSLAALCVCAVPLVGYADSGAETQVVKIAPRAQGDAAIGIHNRGDSSATQARLPFTATFSASSSFSNPFTATFSTTLSVEDPFTASSTEEESEEDPFTVTSSEDSSEDDSFISSSGVPSVIAPSTTAKSTTKQESSSTSNSASSSSSNSSSESTNDGTVEKKKLYNGYIALKKEYIDNEVGFKALNGNFDFVEKLLEESDIQELKNGATILFTIKYEGFKEDELSSSEAENVKKYLKNNDMTIYGIAEMFVSKSLIRDEEYVYKNYPITDFKGNQLTVSFDLPEFNYGLKKGYEREYSLFKVTTGPIAITTTFKDPKVTFSITESGYYCAAYKDVKSQDSAQAAQTKSTKSSAKSAKASSSSSTPKTADSAVLIVGLFMSALGAALASIVLLFRCSAEQRL